MVIIGGGVGIIFGSIIGAFTSIGSFFYGMRIGSLGAWEGAFYGGHQLLQYAFDKSSAPLFSKIHNAIQAQVDDVTPHVEENSSQPNTHSHTRPSTSYSQTSLVTHGFCGSINSNQPIETPNALAPINNITPQIN